MNWGYKCHNFVSWLFSGPRKVLYFLSELSWLYAHYRNGSYSKRDSFFRNQTFFWCVKTCWRRMEE